MLTYADLYTYAGAFYGDYCTGKRALLVQKSACFTSRNVQILTREALHVTVRHRMLTYADVC
jgi:hypothetical protein